MALDLGLHYFYPFFDQPSASDGHNELNHGAVKRALNNTETVGQHWHVQCDGHWRAGILNLPVFTERTKWRASRAEVSDGNQKLGGVRFRDNFANLGWRSKESRHHII